MTDLRIAKDRLLYMYSRLVDGKMLYKKEEAQRFGCSLRSIQRDIEDLRFLLHEQNEASGLVQDLVYNQKLGATSLYRHHAICCPTRRFSPRSKYCSKAGRSPKRSCIRFLIS